MAPVDLSSLRNGIPAELPAHPGPHPDTTIPNAPRRRVDLTQDELVLAVQNALRYFPTHQHDVLAPEFAQELKEEGHIYMHRYVLRVGCCVLYVSMDKRLTFAMVALWACSYRPVAYEMKAYPIQDYPAKCKQAAAVMLMIMVRCCVF
jgi:urocanate hydratase